MSNSLQQFRTIGVVACIGVSLANAQSIDEAARYLAKKDYEKAVPILEKLSAQGHVEAQAQLGAMHFDAIGVPRDTARGIELYELASSQGHPGAQFVLATELFKGQLIGPDKPRAMTLLLASAKQKYAYAQFALCIELSTDGSQYYDAVEAYAWCEASSAKTHKQTDRAARRGTETLGKILLRQGAGTVESAKVRAVDYAKKY